MVTIMNLLIPKDVKQYSIERKYYKKFFYKICLTIDESLIKPGFPRMYDQFGNTGLYTAQQSLLKEICDLSIKDADCKMRTEGKCVSVFTNDTLFIKELFDKLSNRITEYHSPINDFHRETIDNNKRVRVRKRLFENMFKYKVYFSRDWRVRTDNYSEVKEWLHGLEDLDGSRWAVNSTLNMYFNYVPGYKGYTAAIYLNDPSDLMMCQMKFHSEIHYIEEAVLLSNL